MAEGALGGVGRPPSRTFMYSTSTGTLQETHGPQGSGPRGLDGRARPGGIVPDAGRHGAGGTPRAA